MKAAFGFIFFMLFLAGLAFVNLRGMQSDGEASVTEPGQLTNTAWRLTQLGEMPMDDDTPAYLQFDVDGKVYGNGGCNRLTGTFALQDGRLTIGPLATTRMACPEPANSLEISFLEALDQTSTAVRVESRLAFRNGDGRTLARFVARRSDRSP